MWKRQRGRERWKQTDGQTENQTDRQKQKGEDLKVSDLWFGHCIVFCNIGNDQYETEYETSEPSAVRVYCTLYYSTFVGKFPTLQVDTQNIHCGNKITRKIKEHNCDFQEEICDAYKQKKHNLDILNKELKPSFRNRITTTDQLKRARIV